MSPPPVFVSHRSSLAHDTGQHPERIERLRAIELLLEQRGWLGYERVASPPVPREVLERVHPLAHIERIAAASAAAAAASAPTGAATGATAPARGVARVALDSDTVVSAGSYEAALHACGGAVELVERLLAGGAGAVGFSAHRPPGHHATVDRAMGFCLFNNVAVAASHAIAARGLERVLILDWDVHHGNGTSDIFWDSDQVLFVSIHQFPLYPGSGRATEMGEGRGAGHTVNLPVPPGSGDAAYVSLLRDVALPLARAYRPQLVLVSAGFDAHADDPLAGCAVSDAGFEAMSALVRDLGARLGVPVGCVLEGGYDVDALARCVALTMQTLAAAPDVAAAREHAAQAAGEPLPRHQLAVEALARLVPLWPQLSSQLP